MPDAADAADAGSGGSGEPYPDLRWFCSFIGTTRSGHSVVGALLDAHPLVAIPHEVDVFDIDGEDRVRLSFTDRGTMISTLVERARQQAERGRTGHRRHADGTGYKVSYEVVGQHQGRVTRLEVVGNKRGQATAQAFRIDPSSFDALQELAGVPLALVHVIRNPYDNVASMSTVARSVGRYVRRAEDVAAVKAAGWEVYDLYIEDLIAEPGPELARLCGHLGLPAEPAYLEACAAVLLDEPNPARDGLDWTRAELRAIRRAIGRFPWLERYADTQVRPARRFSLR